MDKFPDDFTRQICMTLMEKNQHELLKQIRQEFYIAVNNGISKCERDICLIFPDKLWLEHRKTITAELLARFGRIRVKIANSQCEITKFISDPDEIPNDVKKILIEFWKAE